MFMIFCRRTILVTIENNGALAIARANMRLRFTNNFFESNVLIPEDTPQKIAAINYIPLTVVRWYWRQRYNIFFSAFLAKIMEFFIIFFARRNWFCLLQIAKIPFQATFHEILVLKTWIMSIIGKRW